MLILMLTTTVIRVSSLVDDYGQDIQERGAEGPMANLNHLDKWGLGLIVN